jgi:putative peptide zinc metalloprotease protein
MLEPAKLQLLTRADGDSGFEIFEIDSNRAYAGFKPQRVPETQWDLRPLPRGADGSDHFILKNLSNDHFLLLSSEEGFLWRQLDGRNSLEEIARAFHLAYGAFDYAEIRAFLTKLYHAGLLEDPQARAPKNFVSEQYRSQRQRLYPFVNAWRRFAFKINDADRYCSILYRRGGFILFSPITFWVVVGLAGAALLASYQLAGQFREFGRLLASNPFLSAAAIGVALPLASMLHVLVHALACKAHGRRVRELGFFLLQGIVPTFYADVTDIFMSSRRARLLVDLAGPLVEVFLGSVVILSALATEPGVQQALLFGAGIMLWESALINLYPFSFLEFDGYNILADALGMPTLRNQALALLTQLPSRLRDLRTIQRAELIQLGYLTLCAVSVLIYVVLHLDALRWVFSLAWE